MQRQHHRNATVGLERLPADLLLQREADITVSSYTIGYTICRVLALQCNS